MSNPARVDFGILLHQAYAVFKDAMQEHMRAAGHDDLGGSFGYVFRLLDAEPRKLRQVAEALGITPQGALKVVDDMVAKGYVAREADPDDGRAVLLKLTRRGSSALAEARKFHRSYEQTLARRLGTRRAAALRDMLQDLTLTSEAGRTPLRPL